jgi:hypothetical protein
MSQLIDALTLVMLTGPGGQIVEINPEEVVSIRSPRSVDHMPRSVHCIVFTTDSKFIGVEEPCPQVEKKLKQTD